MVSNIFMFAILHSHCPSCSNCFGVPTCMPHWLGVPSSIVSVLRGDLCNTHDKLWDQIWWNGRKSELQNDMAIPKTVYTWLGIFMDFLCVIPLHRVQGAVLAVILGTEKPRKKHDSRPSRWPVIFCPHLPGSPASNSMHRCIDGNLCNDWKPKKEQKTHTFTARYLQIMGTEDGKAGTSSNPVPWALEIESEPHRFDWWLVDTQDQQCVLITIVLSLREVWSMLCNAVHQCVSCRL